MLKILVLKFKIFYVLKRRLDCFNSQVNNLDDMEREILYRHKLIFWKH